MSMVDEQPTDDYSEEVPSELPSGLTWDEFLALPYELRNVSLVDGEIIVNPPNAQHELVVQNLVYAFKTWTRAGSGHGEVSTQQPVKVNDVRGYQPDVLWFPQQHCAPAGEPRSFSGPPGIVIEILSPSTRTFDMIRKRADYDRIGIAEAWFIDPRPGHYAVIACQRVTAGEPYKDIDLGPDDHLTSPLLDGFELPLADLFKV